LAFTSTTRKCDYWLFSCWPCAMANHHWFRLPAGPWVHLQRKRLKA